MCLIVFVFVVFAVCVHLCSYVSEDTSSVSLNIRRMKTRRLMMDMKNNNCIALMVTAARLQMVDEGDDQSAMIATSGS